MTDFPEKIAGALEGFATRVRGMTVDRLARVITWLAVAIIGLTLLGIAGIFFFIGLFRIAGELVFKVCDCTRHQEIAYAIVGGLFLAVGALLWSKRVVKPAPEPAAEEPAAEEPAEESND